MALILDIETLPIQGVEALVEPAEAAKNLKDPEKIAADIARKEAEQISKAALYPWTARVCALGTIDDDGTERVMLAANEAEEAAAIKHFWSLALRDDNRFCRVIVGFNHRTFDLPVLLARSLLLGIEHPHVSLDRYKSPHVDLMDRLTWFGAIPARSLKWYAKRFDLPVDDTVKGADIMQFVIDGKWDDVHGHCLSDIRLTRDLAERMGVIRGMKAVA